MSKNREFNYLKVKIGDTIYGLVVPITSSKDIMDVITKGELHYIKKGMIPACDPLGKSLGRGAGGWNALRLLHDIPQPGKELIQAVGEAVNRAKRVDEAKDKRIENNSLPVLISKTIKGKPILRDDSIPRYYIESQVFCANCKEPIKGTHTVKINRNGKVEHTDKFVPSEPASPYREGSSKLLHPQCMAKSVQIEDVIDAIKDQTEEIIEEVEQEVSDELAAISEELIKIIENQKKYSAEYARGASHIYHKFFELGGYKYVKK